MGVGWGTRLRSMESSDIFRVREDKAEYPVGLEMAASTRQRIDQDKCFVFVSCFDGRTAVQPQ